MTVGAYTTDPEVEREIEEVCLEEAAQLSLNLTGGVYVNQTAAFSDFHGSGGNPAANAALTDGASWPTASGWWRYAGTRDTCLRAAYAGAPPEALQWYSVIATLVARL